MTTESMYKLAEKIVNTVEPDGRHEELYEKAKAYVDKIDKEQVEDHLLVNNKEYGYAHRCKEIFQYIWSSMWVGGEVASEYDHERAVAEPVNEMAAVFSFDGVCNFFDKKQSDDPSVNLLECNYVPLPDGSKGALIVVRVEAAQ